MGQSDLPVCGLSLSTQLPEGELVVVGAAVEVVVTTSAKGQQTKVPSGVSVTQI